QQVVRGALLSGVLIFGGVVWWLHDSGRIQPAAGGVGDLLEYISYGLSLVGLIAAFVIRAASTPERSMQQRTQWAIMAWALAESGGLLGGVHYLLTGVWRGWAVGALGLLAALILVPVPRRD
ncbi:MAG TPA: hypothetical protein VFD43_03045, partial [Planctomycetota bacterium]|nr:hypothetical protein [Planctomycetota bacterium]